MSVKAAIRPSALPLPKTTSSQSLSSYDRKCMLPVAVDRNRRAGSDPRAGSNSTNSNSSTTSSSTSNIPRNALIRSGSIRSTTSNQEKTRQINTSSTNHKDSNKENNKAKDGSDSRSNRSKSIILNNNNINSAKTKGLSLKFICGKYQSHGIFFFFEKFVNFQNI